MSSGGVGKLAEALSEDQRFALELDEKAVRVVRGRCPLDLAIGETLLRLFEGDRLLELGYARQVDYARERLGISARTMFHLTRLARGLADRPLLRKAVAAGHVTQAKALAILKAASGEAEAAWTVKAMCASLQELQRLAREHGGEPPEVFEAESLWLPMTPSQQDRLDAALAMALETLGVGAPRWQCLEAICQEWISDYPEHVPKAPDATAPLVLGAARSAAVVRQLQAIDEALSVVAEVDDEDADSDDPCALDARLLRLFEARRGFDETFGALAECILRFRSWAPLGYRSFQEYCRERLGMCEKAVRQRAWLERKMFALPELRRALRSGTLTYSKALLVANGATGADIEERIAEAATTTWQQTERETTEREERRNRDAGVRRLWGPKDAALVVTEAIASAQGYFATQGETIDAGEALARVADHFREIWSVHVPRQRGTRERREVLMRHGGLCAVPGCSRPAQHEHHVVYRSRGGSHEKANRVAVCAAHHLRGIHRGRLTVTGRAGELLLWRMGSPDLQPLEVWTTRGNDDVRRAS